MTEDNEWLSTFQRQQPRPVSMPIAYEADDTEALPQNKPSTTHIFAPMHTRPIPVPSAASMPIPIPSNPNVIPGNTLPSAPASPPTPAPSPSPKRRAPDWRTARPHEDIGHYDDDDDSDMAGSGSTFQSRGRSMLSHGLGYRHIRTMFAEMGGEERKRLLAELLNMCDGKQLGFVAGFVAPRLKRDPFGVLPNELCLRVSRYDQAQMKDRLTAASRYSHLLTTPKPLRGLLKYRDVGTNLSATTWHGSPSAKVTLIDEQQTTPHQPQGVNHSHLQSSPHLKFQSLLPYLRTTLRTLFFRQLGMNCRRARNH